MDSGAPISPYFSPLGNPREPLGASWEPLKSLLGASWEVLGASWKALGSILEPSWSTFSDSDALGKHLASNFVKK